MSFVDDKLHCLLAIRDTRNSETHLAESKSTWEDGSHHSVGMALAK